MSQIQSQHDEVETAKQAILLANAGALIKVLKSAIELNIIDILYTATSSGAWLSPSDIAARIPTKNPDAASYMDRLLSFLASFDVVECSTSTNENGEVERAYGAAPICKFLTRNHDDGKGSLAPLFLFHHDEVLDKSWHCLNEAILEGGIPFNRAYGMTEFEYSATDQRFNRIFNEGMSNHSALIMKKVLEVYKGFDGLNVLVDVGGGIGVNLKMIVSRYPHIKGINYDLPHVVANAPSHPGIENVGGNMFVSVPKGDAIFLKWILEDWSDEHCLKILKNCWEALPSNGKVIIVELILPEKPEKDVSSRIVFGQDVILLAQNVGGRQRTQKEYDAMARKSGFSGCEAVCSAYNCLVLECHKGA